MQRLQRGEYANFLSDVENKDFYARNAKRPAELLKMRRLKTIDI